MSATRPDVAGGDHRRAAPARAELTGFGWRPVGRRAPVVAGLDLVIEPGERVLLAGPSGAGKSTVLRALAGALGTTVSGDLTGDVRVDGQIGLLLQNPADAVVSDRIGRDVAFGPENQRVPPDRIWARVERALRAVGLTYPLDRPTAALSGGELQRLALAGVLAMQPGLLLLDEPTSMLDAESAATVRDAIHEVLAETGATAVVVEHRIAPWLEHVDRVVVLSRDGHVVEDSPPGDLATGLSRELGANGVWMPGLPAPAPLDVPEHLVRPRQPPLELRARGLAVDLRARTLRGPVVTPAVRGAAVVLAPSARTVLTGPSGAGKSTLAAAFAGLVRPSGGEVAGTGRPLHRWRSPDLARRVGWVPQNPEHGFLTTRVWDEVAHTGKRLGVDVDVTAVLELFGLGHLGGANPYQLSGGEQRRLALAAALAHGPGVLVLDEPTVGQDRDTWAATVGWLAAAARAGGAVGVATHDVDLVALAEHEVRMRAGEVVTR